MRRGCCCCCSWLDPVADISQAAVTTDAHGRATDALRERMTTTPRRPDYILVASPGRCGTQFLAAVFGSCHGTISFHEPEPTLSSWAFAQGEMSREEQEAALRTKVEAMRRAKGSVFSVSLSPRHSCLTLFYLTLDCCFALRAIFHVGVCMPRSIMHLRFPLVLCGF